MEHTQGEIFTFITNKLTDPGLRNAVSEIVEHQSPEVLDGELRTISRCIEETNQLIAQKQSDPALDGITNTRRILAEYDLEKIPNPFETAKGSPLWIGSLADIIRVANTETGTTYRSPEKINNGNPLSAFRWYLYDGIGRMIAIHIIPTQLKISKEKQKIDGDWIACGITEAAVKLAEEGNPETKNVVKDMVEMGFIDTGWYLSELLVQRARNISA